MSVPPAAHPHHSPDAATLITLPTLSLSSLFRHSPELHSHHSPDTVTHHFSVTLLTSTLIILPPLSLSSLSRPPLSSFSRRRHSHHSPVTPPSSTLITLPSLSSLSRRCHSHYSLDLHPHFPRLWFIISIQHASDLSISTGYTRTENGQGGNTNDHEDYDIGQ